MRELRFRVWHSGKNCWIHDTADACNILGETIMLGAWCRVPMSELNDLVVEQYTGLLDKKGKEIYENDIIKGRVANYLISYEIEYAGYYALNKTKHFEMCPSQFKDFEVIGNIHLNPELLEVK